MTDAPENAISDVDAKPAKKNIFIKILPIAVIVMIFISFFAFGGQKYLSLDALQANYQGLQAWVAANYILAVLAFALVYIIATAASLPGAGVLSITAGLLFGIAGGSVIVITSATIGATLIYLAVRTIFGDFFAKKAGGFVKQMEQGFREDELSYLFILRLIPAFPFWAVNIVSGVVNVRLRNFLLATFFGIMPGSIVYVMIGNGVGALFDAGEEVKLSGLLTQPEVLLPIIGLILLALLPIIYKRVFKKTSAKDTTAA